MSLPQQKRDLTDARLQSLTLPETSGWIAEARQAALARVNAMGLPTRRDEYWKYTNPVDLTSADVKSTGLDDSDDAPVFGGLECLNIVFVDGEFDAELSDELHQDGVSISRLKNAKDSDLHWAKDVYGALEASGQDPVQRPLAALNTAFASDGILIHVTGTPKRAISFRYVQTKPDQEAMLHHVVRVESDATVTILESGQGAARFSSVMEVDVADKGAFHHVRTQGPFHDRRSITHVFTRVREESTFKSFTLAVNGVLTRNECVIEILGDNASSHIAGACAGDGKDFHLDNTVFITHDAVNCESRQVFKNVLRNAATGVFQGKILVKEGAQKTDGYQISQSLLLDDDAQFLAKPELEIYADDVACSHGSTSGAIDEEQLFYLRARGVPQDQAQDLLVFAFMAEALEEIEDEAIAEVVGDLMTRWLSQRRGG